MNFTYTFISHNKQ